MSNTKFITNILNIEETDIDKCESVSSNGDVTFFIRLKKVTSCCPFCGSSKIRGNGFYKKKLNHSTLKNRRCSIIYEAHRFICSDCIASFSETNPFSLKGMSNTTETITNVLIDLKNIRSTFSMVAKNHNLSSTQVIKIFDTYVNIPRKQLPEILSMDEFFFCYSNYDALYSCLLLDFSSGIIIDVLPDRRKNYLHHYFQEFDKEELNHVKFVSIDMYEPYKIIAQIYFKKACIGVDSFHVIKNITDQFNKIRLRLRRSSKNETYIYLISKFKHLLFLKNINLDNTGKYNKKLKRIMNYRQILEIMFDLEPELKIAYDLMQNYIYFNESADYESADAWIESLINQFIESQIYEYEGIYKMLQNWKLEIINSFLKLNGRRISNGPIESKNRLIKVLMFNANGSKNFKRTRNRIMYSINKNDTFTLK